MKYARIERERRFLLARTPADLPLAFRRIRDRYVDGTVAKNYSIMTTVFLFF